MVEMGARVVIGGNMDIVEPNLPIAHQGEAIPHINATGTDLLYLSAQEGNTRLVGVGNFVLKPGMAVIADQFMT